MKPEPAPTRIFDALVLILIVAFVAVQAYSDAAVSLLAPPSSDTRTLGELLTTPVRILAGLLVLASAGALVWAWRQRKPAGAAEQEALREPERGAPLAPALLVCFGLTLISTIFASAFFLDAGDKASPAIERADGLRVSLGAKDPPGDAPPLVRSIHAEGSILMEPRPALTVNGALLDRPRLLAPGDVVVFKGQSWTARPPAIAPRLLLLAGLVKGASGAAMLLLLSAFAFPGLPALGLGRTPIGPELKRGALGYLAFLPVMLLSAIAANLGCKALGLNPVPHALEAQLGAAGPPEWGLAFASACLAAPLWEELLFRGLLLGGMARLISVRRAMLLSAGLFAVVHVGLPSVLPLFFFGLFLAFLTAKSPRGSIIAAVVAHALHNSLTMTLFILTLP